MTKQAASGSGQAIRPSSSNPASAGPSVSIPPNTLSQPVVTVWFDGGCPLCTREIALFRKLDRKGAIRFEDVSRANASCPVDQAELLARFHAREEGQPVMSGAAAFAAMWRAIPALRPFGELARVPAILWLLERLYVTFLRVRPQLQKLVS